MDNQQEDRLWVLLAKQHSGEASEAELAELKALLNIGNIPSDTLRRLQHLWETPLASVRAETGQTPRTSTSYRRQKPVTHRFWWAAAAVVALTTVVGLLQLQPTSHRDQPLTALQPDTSEKGVIKSERSAKTKTILTDGTVVWLHHASQISYQPHTFGKQNREVTLIGEAFFDVVKNERLPFVVHAGSLVVEVKGTAFNVKAYPGNPTVEAVLLRGLVDVYDKRDPGKKVTLQPNEKIVVPSQHVGMAEYRVTRQERRKGQPLDETVWMAGTLDFDNEPFVRLAPKLESWYNVKIGFTDDDVKELRFSATIVDETLQQTLNAMQLSFPFDYGFENDTLWIGTGARTAQ